MQDDLETQRSVAVTRTPITRRRPDLLGQCLALLHDLGAITAHGFLSCLACAGQCALAVACVVLLAVMHGPVMADETPLENLRGQAAELEAQNQGLRKMLSSLQSGDVYLVIDTENNRLTVRQGEKVLLNAVVGTGSRQYVEEETGRNWFFESPLGSLTVLGKERNPVWIRPDWSYVEENMPVPDPADPDRIVREVLGKYALILGEGYKIHGTKYKELLGTHFTHGCISVGDNDLEYLYKNIKVGTKVYIY